MFLSPHDGLEFSAGHKQILKETKFSEHSPGTLLHDFDAFLSFVKESDFALTDAHQLPLRSLPEINARLANPIKLGLKRPQQKSYPHINGLYLLLRASGLTAVDGTGKKPRLIVVEEIYQQWQELNMTEHYCTLLETWLLRGDEEIIGEHGRSWGLPDHLRNWQSFYNRTPKEGLQVKGNRDTTDTIKYFPGMFHLGLLDLFGLITIKRAEMQAGKSWQIDTIEHTALGKALLSLLVTIFVQNIEELFGIEDQLDEQMGLLQAFLQPYFPAWKQNLSMPQWEFREGTYIYNVSLGKYWGCKLEIGATQLLDDLAYGILYAVNFDRDHLYRFSYPGYTGKLQHIEHSYMDEGPFTSEIRVGDVPLAIGQSMIYLFDFGDSWEFDVTLEDVKPGGGKQGAKVLESHGEPPEQYPSWDDEY
jgi:hypothetical protein